MTFDYRIPTAVWDEQHVLIERNLPKESSLFFNFLHSKPIFPSNLSVLDESLAKYLPFRVVLVVVFEPENDSVVLDNVS